MNTKILNITRRVGLIDMFKQKGFKVGVEVGTDEGGYAKDICTRFPEVILYTIDPWLPYNEGNEVKDAEKIEQIYQKAVQNLQPFTKCQIIRKTSMEAIKIFYPNTIDFVFIDGNHEYPFVYQDIVEWTKIVKPGGIVAGHDYKEDPNRKYGVIEAVNKYVEENNIDPLYILRKGTYVDCWMFIKP